MPARTIARGGTICCTSHASIGAPTTKAPTDTATIPVVAKMSKTEPDTRVAHCEDEVRTVGPSPAVLSDEEKAFLDAMVELVLAQAREEQGLAPPKAAIARRAI